MYGLTLRKVRQMLARKGTAKAFAAVLCVSLIQRGKTPLRKKQRMEKPAMTAMKIHRKRNTSCCASGSLTGQRGL